MAVLGRGLQVDDESRAFAGAFAKRANGAAMHLDDRFTNGEPEPETFPTDAPLLESVENFLQILGLNPNAGVFDFYVKRLRLGIEGPDGNRPVAGRKFRGVLQHVPENLLKP